MIFRVVLSAEIYVEADDHAEARRTAAVFVPHGLVSVLRECAGPLEISSEWLSRQPLRRQLAVVPDDRTIGEILS